MRVLILGGGFGGLAAAKELRRLLDEEHEIIVIDKKYKFSVGFANLWLMTGLRSAIRYLDLRMLNEKGIKFVRDEILSIDPKNRIVKTKDMDINADYIVIALGAYMNSSIEGFDKALNLYDSEDAIKISHRLERLREGKIVILIDSIPFKCPPAPYEAALILDEYLKKKNIRDKIEISLITPEEKPVAVAGDNASKSILNMLNEHNIIYKPRSKVLRIEDSKILFDSYEENYNLLIGIPAHKAPPIIKGENDWIVVDKSTLKTRYDNVYAIGDITNIKLSNGSSLPKAGTFAEHEGIVVANNIAASIKDNSDGMRYDGYGYCYIDVGNGTAALAEGYFYNNPIEVNIRAPTKKYRMDMEEFEEIRLRI